MLKVIITVASIVCCVAGLFGIKMMDLPGLITVLLVIVDIGLVMLVLIYAMGEQEPDRDA
jgi:hypothetical protein